MQVRALIHNHDAKEMLYLGPDENITPVDINWVVRRADKRGYPLANAFMSSKPASGINHKARAARVETTACSRRAAPPAARERPNVARESVPARHRAPRSRHSAVSCRPAPPRSYQ